MISKKDIKNMDFNNIEDIYLYIVASETNGAIKQYKELIKKLSKDQFKDFILWLDDDFIQIKNALKVRL